MIEKKLSLNAHVRVFLFCVEKIKYIKANFQVKQVIHYTEVIILEAHDNPLRVLFTLLWYKDITIRGC